MNISRPRLRHQPCAAGIVALVCGALQLAVARADEKEPAQVEVKAATAKLTYLDGSGEQQDVQRGDRFTVVRRIDAYYVVRSGDREALISLNHVIPVKQPPPRQIWEYVVTTANAPVSVKHGRRGVPETVPQGQVLEVLARDALGSTLYVLLDNGRTGEISVRLVRSAKPEERPPEPPRGQIRGPVALGCEISIDRQRNVLVEYVYPGSFGQRLGLQPGMRILKVNGREIHSAADYDQASALLGGNLRLLVQRVGLTYPELIEYIDPRNRR